MKSIRELSMLILFMAVLVFSSCDKTDAAKALALQTYNLSKEMIASVSDLNKIAKLGKEAADIALKVDALSSVNKTAYKIEMARLVSSDAGTLLKDLPAAFSQIQNSINSPEIQEAFKRFSSLF